MKNIKKILLGLVILSPALCFGESLIPKEYLIGGSPMGISRPVLVDPLRFMYLSFDETIEVTPEAEAYVLHGNEKVAKAVSFEIKNYESPTHGKQGCLWISFSDECLPKGEKYTFCLPYGSISTVDNKKVTNDDILYPFEIPADLGEARFQNENGCEIESISRFGTSCNWMYEVGPVGNPEWELYREGELIRKYPASVSSDWDLGSAFFSPKEEIRFEKGVRYSLVLPDGSVSSLRPDIVNKNTVWEFVGGYVEPIPSPGYYWNNFIDEIDKGIINEITFYYNVPIKLIPGKTVILTQNEPEYKKWEAVPTLSSDGKKWVMTADFGGVKIYDGPSSYTLSIPEGLVVTADGDIAVNNAQSINSNTTGLSNANIDESNIRIDGKRIYIEGTNSADIIMLSDISGRMVRVINNPADTVTMEVDGSGFYILSIGEKRYKINIR